MQTFIVQPQKQSQIGIVKTLLDAAKVPYKIAPDAEEDDDVDDLDETELLKRNPAGAARLNESSEQLHRGETVTIRLDDLWN